MEALLGDYIARKRANRESFPTQPFTRSSSTDSFATDDGIPEQLDMQASAGTVIEKIRRRRSMQLRNQQQTWQVLFSHI